MDFRSFRLASCGSDKMIRLWGREGDYNATSVSVPANLSESKELPFLSLYLDRFASGDIASVFVQVDQIGYAEVQSLMVTRDPFVL